MKRLRILFVLATALAITVLASPWAFVIMPMRFA